MADLTNTAKTLTGQCLCGAVTVTAHWVSHGASACHCRMCQRWSGSAVWCISAKAVDASGPVATYRSSAFAERAFCSVCGSHLWIHDDGGDYDLSPGLFDDLSDAPLVREVYADRAMACVTLSGDHPRITAEDYENAHKSVPDHRA